MMDRGVPEAPKDIPQEENSIDGIPTNLKNVWESGKLEKSLHPQTGKKVWSVTSSMGYGLNGIIQRQWVMLLVMVGTSQAAR